MTTQTAIMKTLAAACDHAAASNDSETLRWLHAFLLQIATNYVRLRLGAIDSCQAGTFEVNGRTIDGPAEAQDMVRVANEIITDIYANG